MLKKLFRKKTAYERQLEREKKQETALRSDAEYISRKTALDAADIESAYQEHPNDLSQHKKAYENDNSKMIFGTFFAGIGIAGVYETALDVSDTTTAMQQKERNEDDGYAIIINTPEGGISLALAFGGAALIASGIKGKKAIKEHIRNRVDSAQPKVS